MNYIKYHQDECWRWTQNHVGNCRGQPQLSTGLGILKFEGRRRTDKGVDLNREIVPEGSRRIVKEHASSVSIYYHGEGGVIYYVRIMAGMAPVLDEETGNYILDEIEKYHCTMVKPTLDQWREEWDKMDH